MPAEAQPPLVAAGGVAPFGCPLGGRAPVVSLGPSCLLRLASELLAITLSRQCLFRTTLVAWLQIERVFLDVLDNVFLLNLALEPSEGALDGLAFLNLDFSHACNTPSPAKWLPV
jgi:hypothetical protein